MIDFTELRMRIQNKLDSDRGVQSVETAGASLEAAVLDAATLLGLSVRHIEYEIVEHGSAGFLGQGAKAWKIMAYASEKIDVDTDEEYDEDETYETEELEVVSEDGDVFVQLRAGDVLLKVNPPLGKGARVTEKMAVDALLRRRVETYNIEILRKTVEEAAAKYIRVAGYPSNIANNSFARLELSEDEMQAVLTITPPGHGGGDVSYDELLSLLRNNGVIYGINEKELGLFSDRPSYGKPFCAAEGIKPVNGMDAYMEYFFEIDPTKARLHQNEKGEINFKELNLIQNVRAGQPIAKKIPAEQGKHGRTVTGKMLPATDGKDMQPPIGKNAHLDNDKLTIIADVNGQVVLAPGGVGIEEVYTVDGNVGIETGNIIFLGSVVVNGGVDEGYSIKATGNIEISGHVDKASLEAEGEIIVKLGITGKQGVMFSAGHSVIAKFIENAVVKSGGTVMVADGILNSTVDAQQKIVVHGKRAAIIGGRYRAGEEISAKNIGSASGNTETICEVGSDPEVTGQIEKIDSRLSELQDEFDDVQRNIATLEIIKKQRKELPEEKEQYLTQLKQNRQQIADEIAANNTEKEQKREYLQSLKKRGSVSASDKCYSGTIININGVKEPVRSEFKNVTFTLENGLVRFNKYEDRGGGGGG